MAKHQNLCFQRGSRSEKSDQPAPDQPAELVHRAEDSADSLPRANHIGFATGTGIAVWASSSHSAVKAAIGSPQIDPFSLMANAKDLPTQESLNLKMWPDNGVVRY